MEDKETNNDRLTAENENLKDWKKAWQESFELAQEEICKLTRGLEVAEEALVQIVDSSGNRYLDNYRGRSDMMKIAHQAYNDIKKIREGRE